jgi:hypothetical protein
MGDDLRTIQATYPHEFDRASRGAEVARIMERRRDARAANAGANGAGVQGTPARSP